VNVDTQSDEAFVNPYLIEGPAHVSTSGGKTSGFMLRQVLDAHGGKLPPDVHALFCNTGKEREESLLFVHEIETRWDVPIVWLEYVAPDWPEGPLVCFGRGANNTLRLGFYSDEDDPGNEASFRVVSYDTASRDGEPFDALIRHRSRLNEHGGTLPNPVAAWCSSELKQRTMRRWMVAQGYDEWTSVVGLRADEKKRVARMNGRKLERGWIELPLARAGVVEDHVTAYWDAQPFTLHLRAYEGNCDLCFKKTKRKILTIMAEGPRRAGWWIGGEEQTGARWRQDRPPYVRLQMMAQTQGMLAVGAFDVDEEDALPCNCTD
jgi:3'-phosphoadenosine 5'-phosphosulfate sulfotransferase (PAPS reductase)/FAD synthetase